MAEDGLPAMQASLWAAVCYESSRSVAEAFPLQKLHTNKLAVYCKACPEGAASFSASQRVIFSRWSKVKPLSPPALPLELAALADRLSITGQLPSGPFSPAHVRPDVFTYPPSTPAAAHWHMNFADVHLFGFYDSSLFAQDELQCSELPVLGHIREALSAPVHRETAVVPMTRCSESFYNISAPTPVLISGVERLVKVHSLYGGNFSRATPTKVDSATEVLRQRVVCNILAMEAPKDGWGVYTKAQVWDVLESALVGYVAAQAHSKLLYEDATSVVIHTGDALLQAAAARIAGVELVYHTVDVDGAADAHQGLKALDSVWSPGISLDDFVDRVEKLGFRWGIGNGT